MLIQGKKFKKTQYFFKRLKQSIVDWKNKATVEKFGNF